MGPEEFLDWLKGFLEASDPRGLTPSQVKIIKDQIIAVEEKVSNDFWDKHTAFDCYRKYNTSSGGMAVC